MCILNARIELVEIFLIENRHIEFHLNNVLKFYKNIEHLEPHGTRHYFSVPREKFKTYYLKNLKPGKNKGRMLQGIELVTHYLTNNFFFLNRMSMVLLRKFWLWLANFCPRLDGSFFFLTFPLRFPPLPPSLVGFFFYLMIS